MTMLPFATTEAESGRLPHASEDNVLVVGGPPPRTAVVHDPYSFGGQHEVLLSPQTSDGSEATSPFNQSFSSAESGRVACSSALCNGALGFHVSGCAVAQHHAFPTPPPSPPPRRSLPTSPLPGPSAALPVGPRHCTPPRPPSLAAPLIPKGSWHSLPDSTLLQADEASSSSSPAAPVPAAPPRLPVRWLRDGVAVSSLEALRQLQRHRAAVARAAANCLPGPGPALSPPPAKPAVHPSPAIAMRAP
eukprot:EG_transcript_3113